MSARMRRKQMNTAFHSILVKTAALTATLLGVSGLASADTTVNLTVQRASAALPDGTTVPMWAFCQPATNAITTNAGATAVGGSCSAASWAPGPTIVVPGGELLTINLTNTLNVPTSLTIVGQYGGGGLGSPVRVPSPTHAPQTSTTWPAVAGGSFTPPAQGTRARSFVPEAGAVGSQSSMQSYSWKAGVLRPGTYLYETGSHPSLQAPMGLYGVLIVTQIPTSTSGLVAGQAYPGATPPGTNPYGSAYAGVPYDADATYLLSEIDPVQNAAVDAAEHAGPTAVPEDLVSTDPTCVQTQKGTLPCYPAAVNYRPTYFLINGSPFDASNPAATTAVVSDFAANATATTPSSLTGNVLVRFVNAGLRTHVPAFNGMQMAVVSEDGNLAPGFPKVQSEVNLPPGRTVDALIQPASNGAPPTTTSAVIPVTQYSDAAYSLYDRALALAGGNLGNTGLHGYLAVAPVGTTSVNGFLGTAKGGVATVTPSAASYTFTLAPNVLSSFSASVATNSVGLSSTVTGGTAPTNGTLSWGAGGVFTYTPTASALIKTGDVFTYCSATIANLCGTVTLSIGAETATILPPATPPNFTSAVSTLYSAKTRSTGVLAGYTSTDGYQLSAALSGTPSGCTVLMNSDGSFSAAASARTGSACTFGFTVSDPRNTATATSATATVTFPTPSNLRVTVADALNGSTGTVPAVTDYMWIMEEDQTWHNRTPGVTLPWDANTPPAPTLATAFHRSHMPVVAAGCTGPVSCGDGAGGQSIQGGMVGGTFNPTATGLYSSPADVALDPTKYYFLSVLPGDAANPVINAFGGDAMDPTQNCLTPTPTPSATPTALGTTTSTSCGHSMGGAPIGPGQVQASVKVEPNPLRPAALSIYIFEDNSPTNNDYDANEVGLGGFEILVFDVAGRSGDPVGQMTYDAFNMPLTNSLLGVQGCPNETTAGTASLQQTNLVGVVYTCPDGDRQIASVSVTGQTVTVETKVPHQFAASLQGANPTVDISGLGAAALNGSFPINIVDGTHFTFANPGVSVGTTVLVVGNSMVRDATTYQLAGQALINNVMPGRFDVVAHPGAAREGAGETWYQVSTLEGTPGQDAFTKANEPNYFQEFGPPGFHTFIGWVNPKHLADQNTVALAQNTGGTSVIKGQVTSLHMSRTVMETLWDAGSNAAIKQSNCFVAINQVGETGNDIAFTACDKDGNFKLPPVPSGQQYELVIWDQWLDQIIAFKNITANQTGTSAKPKDLDLKHIPVFSWFTRIESSVYIDSNGNGKRDAGEPGVPLVPVTIHFRDGSVSNILTTDGDGNAVFNELFPLFNWYVIESDQTRFNGTGVEVVVDAGGAPDCVNYNSGVSDQGAIDMTARCPKDIGTQTAGIANSSYVWTNPLAPHASYGAVPSGATSGTAVSTHRSDPDTGSFDGMFQGVQTFINQTQTINWGRRTFGPNENGGISGMVVYTSTRGFDDPSLELQFMWEPGVPRVQINIYKEQPNADGTTGYILVNTTQSTSWDDWASRVYGSDTKQYMLIDGVLRDPTTGVPAPAGVTAGAQVNMTCPGQDSNDPFLPYALGKGNQFRCYDGFHLWNQVQPAVFDGYWSVGTDSAGNALPAGTYMVEMVPPPGYEVVKEEDKNILIGDAWVAPAAQQFGGLSNIFIMPDQASLAAAYNPSNPGNANTTTALGFVGAKLSYPKCVGQLHQVPDYLSLFPASGQIAPFAGAMKSLCDRKEVVLSNQESGTANFFLFTNTPRASHFTGLILNDAAAEINAAAPDFGEKAAASYVPVSLKDFNGVEIERIYADQWGTYNGMTPSTWQVNVPNPAGYSPNMLVTCMNDPGPIADPANPGQTMVDPLYNPMYSNFCYTNPFMPGMTVYLDTPILPVSAFAAGYNPPDCALPAATPAIKRVDGDSKGPWVAAADGKHTITITALGDAIIQNPNYQGPSATSAPYNARNITRHYGFGATQGTGSVSVNGIALTITSWSDAAISATVPTGVKTGELAIVTNGGQKSVDSVTLTVEALAKPLVVVKPVLNAAIGSGSAHPIQDAIDAAKPGDLIMIEAGNYPELVIMWKPVRLQGVGAASVVINAAKYPTQKLQAWRPLINQYFGVDTVAGNQVPNSQIDPLPNQEVTGGIVLLEPSVLATEEGAGITVLAKNPESVGADGLPNAMCPKDVRRNTRVSKVLTSSYPDQVLFPPTSNTVGIVSTTILMSDSNFNCAASRIDGLSVTGGDSGGGIYVNGWANGLEIANNRVFGNAGSFNGGVRVGVPYLEGLTSTRIERDGTVFGFDVGVHIHHNMITHNATVEANPGTVTASNSSGAGGGLSICSGTDNYLVDYNFICGNYSTADGGGIGHIGVSNNGKIAHNTIIFNQSYQQTAPVNGGGIVVEGEQGAIGGLSLGTGNLTIDSNVIRGNFAQAGHGGGVRLQQVNGADVSANRSNSTDEGRQPWYAVTITNNMITNNVSGWGGGGISAQDALSVVVANNTIAQNDSVGIVGTMIGTNPLSQTNALSNTTGYPSPAGISVDATSSLLVAEINRNLRGNYSYASLALYNDVVWKNRSFYFAATAATPNSLCPSNTVMDAYSLKCTPLPKETVVGQCVDGASYWDLGTTDDSSVTPGSNLAGAKLNPTYSVLTSTSGYAGIGNNQTDPQMVKPYCNGARANPAFIFEPGQPFLDPATQNLTAGATLDEAGNFVDVRFGPLYLTAPEGDLALTPGTVIGDYHLAGNTGGAYNAGGTITGHPATLALDIDSDKRPQNRGIGTGVDIGADEFVPPGPAASITPATGTLGTVQTGQTASVAFTITNTGNSAPNLIVGTATSNNALYSAGNNCPTAGLTIGATCTLTVTFAPTGAFPVPAGTPENATITVASNAVNGSQTVAVTGTAVPPSAARTSPASFGNAETGVTTPETVIITNNGSGPWTYANAVVTGARYTLGTGGTCATAGSVAVGATCTVVVNVTVPTGGDGNTYTGGLAFSESALQVGSAALMQTVTQNFALTVNGRRPQANVAPGTLNFGTVVSGTTSTALSSTVTNTSGGGISVVFAAGDVTVGGTNVNQFTVTNTCAPGVVAATCTVSATFTPTSGGLKTATVTISSGGTTLGTVTLRGTGGVPAISLGTTTLNVGGSGTVVGNGTATLTNNGGAPLTIGTILVAKSANPNGNGVYSISGGSCHVGGVVAAGGTCTVTIHLTAGSQTTGTLTVSGVQQGTTTPTYTATRALTGR
jgi:hypothetical protein